MLRHHKPLGVAIGLIGNVMVAGALFMLLQGGECGMRAGKACAGNMGLWALLLPGGVIVSMAGMIFGGYVVSLVGLFLAIGLGTLAATIFGEIGPGPWFGYPFGLAFVATGLFLGYKLSRKIAKELRAERKAAAKARKAEARAKAQQRG